MRTWIVALTLALTACRPTPMPPTTPQPTVTAPRTTTPEAVRPMLASGDHFLCELRRDGSVWCRGSNDRGQLGDGSNDAHMTPQRVENLPAVTHLVAAEATACAVTRDGRVVRWGWSEVPGEAGNHPGTGHAVTTPEELSFGGPVADVVVGDMGFCARLVDGRVRCLRARVVDDLEALRDAVALVASARSLCGRMRDGRVRCVSEREPRVSVSEIDDVREVVSAGERLVALRGDGTVVGLDVGPTSLVSQEVPEARGATAIWGSRWGWCFARGDRLVCRSANEASVAAEGHGMDATRLLNLPVMHLRAPVAATLFGGFGCAMEADRDEARCWGEALRDEAWELGSLAQPVLAGGRPLSGVVDLVTAGGGVCALFADAAPRCWGSLDWFGALGDGMLRSVVAQSSEVFRAPTVSLAWGDAIACGVVGGELRCALRGPVSSDDEGAPVAAPDRVVRVPAPGALRSVVVGAREVCAVLTDRRVACVPNERLVEAARTSAGDAPSLTVRAGFTGVQRLVTRASETCALVDGAPLRCWLAPEPQPEAPTEGPAEDFAAWGTRIQEEASARGEAEDALSWRRAERTTDSQFGGVATLDPQLGAPRSVAHGARHTCVLDARGAVWCGGAGRNGQLGSGLFSWRVRPERVPLDGVADEVASGAFHSCARIAGNVWCWGDNMAGQLGDGTRIQRAVPVRVEGVEGATRLVAAAEHTCAVVREGRVQCWGANGSYAIGDGTRDDRLRPTFVLGE